MKTIIGLNPKLLGSIAILRGTQLTVFDTPITVMKKGRGTKRDYAEATMADILQDYESEQCHVFAKKVYSVGFGIWRGIIAALQIPCTYVTPQTWEEAIMRGVADKNAARLRAQQLFPAYADLFVRKKDDGRAEASLIAHYGRGQI